jgi:hypothetical protein
MDQLISLRVMRDLIVVDLYVIDQLKRLCEDKIAQHICLEVVLSGMNFYYTARTLSDTSFDFFLEHFKELKE